jgi:uncharacterized protein YbbK (DUF523 family)
VVSKLVKLVSACLCGINCNYKGESKPDEGIIELVRTGNAIPVCPEQLGGLTTPRPPSEISGGTSLDVLDGKAKVVNNESKDVTNEFVKGAFEVLKIAMAANVTEAILKARSPSCGHGKIYDGTFHGILIDGDGVTAALLKRNGITVLTEEEYGNKSSGP